MKEKLLYNSEFAKIETNKISFPEVQGI